MAPGAEIPQVIADLLHDRAGLRPQASKLAGRLSEAGSQRAAPDWRTLAAGCIAFGVAVLIRIWSPISAYQRHLQQQSTAMFAEGTAAQHMPDVVTRVPVVRNFLSVILPFFRDAAGHEWVRRLRRKPQTEATAKHARLQTASLSAAGGKTG